MKTVPSVNQRNHPAFVAPQRPWYSPLVSARSTPSALPPGPNVFATFGFIRNPYRFLDECARRYGDWFTLRVPGVAPFVSTSEPSAIREVFLGDTNLLHAGKANRPLGVYMGERSVLFLDGDAHLHDRRLILPAFQGERMRAYGPAMRALTRETIAKWPLGKGFGVYPSLRALTFGVIMRAASAWTNPASRRTCATHRAVVRALLRPLRQSVPATGVPHRSWAVESLGPRGRLNREMEIRAVRRICAAAGLTNGKRRGHLVDAAASARRKREPLSDTVLRDEMMTLLLAGMRLRLHRSRGRCISSPSIPR